jgi:Holliday junction DNA helicase RuvA
LSLIAGISGAVEAKTLDSVLVRVGGFVLAVAAPLPTLGQLTLGATVTLHTHLLVREDDLALYGFASAEERDLFARLLAVSGVGPRLGLALLSTLSAEALCRAILSEDIERLARTPGVGKKTAQRLVIELKGPITKMLAAYPDLAGAGGAAAGPMLPAGSSIESDAVEALTGLGYSAAEVMQALRAIPDAASLPLDELIVRALRSLAR